MTGTVWFVGAGPGGADLITIRGRDLLAEAGAVLYAGSLVSEAVTRWAPPGCVVADSKGMTLEEIGEWLTTQAARHRTVVRLQTGDPSLYGTLIEVVRHLDTASVEVGVVPGVSSAMASAATAVESLTLPEVTQTVIFTRQGGRTPMPPGESLAELGRHGTTLCIFLSITLMQRVVEGLTEAGWTPESPVVVVHKAGWPGEEQVVRATLADVQQRCREAGIRSQAMIIASPALGARHWPEVTASRLYDKHFSHRYRKAVGSDRNGGKNP